MLRHHWLWAGLALTSCVVGSFSIVEELPSGGAGSGGATAGVSSGDGGTTTGGSDSPAAGRSQGGQNPQGGSAPQAGEGVVPEAGGGGIAQGGAGGEPNELPPKPCDSDLSGMNPLLCDEFENGVIDPARWQPPPGISPELVTGPHGTETHAVRLPGIRLQSLIDNLGVDAAGAQVTVSFWVKVTSTPQNQATVMGFGAGAGAQVLLRLRDKELVWQLDQNPNITAPSKPPALSFMPQVWFCVALYLTSVHMDINYYDAASPANVHTWVIDDTPTVAIDDIWLNQPAAQRKVQAAPSFGADPTFPSEMLLDDVRIARDTSNVCGIPL